MCIVLDKHQVTGLSGWEYFIPGFEDHSGPQPSTSMEIRMKKTVLILGAAITSLLTATAFAQSKGEADPAGAKALPAKAATAEEKAAAKAARRAEGTEAAKKAMPGDDRPASAGTAKVASKEERKAARAKRKAATAAAVKKGETSSGEK
jgi:hypothetical protein